MAKKEIRQGNASLKEVLELMIREMGLGDKLKEARLLEVLPEILGANIMKKVERYYFNDRKLFLKVSSAPLRNELLNMKEAIIARMNQEAGEELIVDIIFR